MSKDFSKRLCSYIHENFRSKYKSNREFADVAGIDEKVVRLIEQEEYNLSLKKFKLICDSQNVKMSKVLENIGE